MSQQSCRDGLVALVCLDTSPPTMPCPSHLSSGPSSCNSSTPPFITPPPTNQWQMALLNASTTSLKMPRCTSLRWTAQLPWVLLGLWTSPKEDINMLANELVYGEALVVPAKFFPFFRQDMSLKLLHRSVKPFTTHQENEQWIFIASHPKHPS